MNEWITLEQHAEACKAIGLSSSATTRHAHSEMVENHVEIGQFWLNYKGYICQVLTLHTVNGIHHWSDIVEVPGPGKNPNVRSSFARINLVHPVERPEWWPL